MAVLARRVESGAVQAPRWSRWRDEKLLSVRMCDLRVTIAGTPLEQRIARLHEELESRGLPFRPHTWLSSEWFSPDGVPGVAIPFYLAHPRLMRLEHSQMLEVEGGTQRWCLRILRHEAGHAIDTAYRLHRRRRYREHFGLASTPYPTEYLPRPYSRSYVVNLGSGYAQSHPAEDFAETFAVWLKPGSRWRSRYRGWPALRKLVVVDQLMEEISAGAPAVVRSRREVEPLRELRATLRQHYEEKRSFYGEPDASMFDRPLRQLFVDASDGGVTAASFLVRLRPELRRAVARYTGERQYTIDRVLAGMIERCRALKLRLLRTEEEARTEAHLLAAVASLTYLREGHHRLAL